MAQPDGENVAAPQSSKSQKDFWDKIQIVSGVAIPVVIGLGSYFIQQSITKESVAKDYVGIATTILESQKGEKATNLREWAVSLLGQYSPIPLSPDSKRELKSGGLTGLSLSGLLSGRESFSAISSSPDGKQVALMKTILDRGRSIVEVFDSQTFERISHFDVGTRQGSPSLVWFRDGSKLLVCRSHSGIGYVSVFDVAQGKLLGEEHQTKGPDGEIENVSFSEDGLSINIKKADGKSEVWPPPP
jgi:WD40 repeat protein